MSSVREILTYSNPMGRVPGYTHDFHSQVVASVYAISPAYLFSAYTGDAPLRADNFGGGSMTLATIWLTIARKECKEFADSLRSRTIWGIVVIIAVMTSLSAGSSLLIPDVEGGAEMAIGGASQFAGLLVPIMTLIAAYLAIAGERESGSLKVILGLPPSWGEVLFGKFLGRSGVGAIGLALGFVVSGVVTAVLYGGLPGAFIGTTVFTVLLGVSFVGITIGISAVTATRPSSACYSVAELPWKHGSAARHPATSIQ